MGSNTKNKNLLWLLLLDFWRFPWLKHASTPPQKLSFDSFASEVEKGHQEEFDATGLTGPLDSLNP